MILEKRIDEVEYYGDGDPVEIRLSLLMDEDIQTVFDEAVAFHKLTEEFGAETSHQTFNVPKKTTHLNATIYTPIDELGDLLERLFEEGWN